MKNILVLAGGGDSDQNVFASALGIAQPLGAHPEFLHIQVDPGEAALSQPHAEFARGPAMRGYYSASRPSASCGPPLRGIISSNSANFAGSASRTGLNPIVAFPQAGARKWARPSSLDVLRQTL
jgi:hypothetical protein